MRSSNIYRHMRRLAAALTFMALLLSLFGCAAPQIAEPDITGLRTTGSSVSEPSAEAADSRPEDGPDSEASGTASSGAGWIDATPARTRDDSQPGYGGADGARTGGSFRRVRGASRRPSRRR